MSDFSYAVGTSSEGSQTPRTSPSCSSNGRSGPISPIASPYFQAGLSSPLSPLCNDHPITQLHLQTDFELFRLEQELGSGNVPDPLIPDPIFEEDFAAVMASLEASGEDQEKEDTETLMNSWQDCSICSDGSCVEISARALDLEDIPPPARLQSITEWDNNHSSVTLSPRAADADENTMTAAKAMFSSVKEHESGGHPFSVLKEPDGANGPAVASVSIHCTMEAAAPSSTENLSDDDLCSSSIASDGSNEDIAWLKQTLPWGDELQQQETSDDFVSCGAIDKDDGAINVQQAAWPLGILAAGLTCLGSHPCTDAQEPVMQFMALLLSWHMKEGREAPIKHIKDPSGVSETPPVFFNHLYIMHHLWARSRVELLKENYYDSDCCSMAEEGHLSPDLMGGAECIRNPLFCALDLPQRSPRSPRARVPLPISSPRSPRAHPLPLPISSPRSPRAHQVPLPISYATAVENANGTTDLSPQSADESRERGPDSPISLTPSADPTGNSPIMHSEGPSLSILATSESSLSMTLMEPLAEPAAAAVRGDNADDRATQPLQSLRSRYESSISSRSTTDTSGSVGAARSTLVKPEAGNHSRGDLVDAAVRRHGHEEGSTKDAFGGRGDEVPHHRAVKASAPLQEAEDERSRPESPFSLSPAGIARTCRALAEEEEWDDLLGGLAGSSSSPSKQLQIAYTAAETVVVPADDMPCEPYADATTSSTTGGDGARMMRNAPSCGSCGSHDLICITCGSRTLPQSHPHPQSCVSGQNNAPHPQTNDLWGMKTRKEPPEAKIPVGLLDEYMDICDELLRATVPCDAVDSVFDVSSIGGDASGWMSPPREDSALAGVMIPGLQHEQLDSGEDVIEDFLSHQQDDYFGNDMLTFGGVDLFGIDASEMSTKHRCTRSPVQHQFVAQNNAVCSAGTTTPLRDEIGCQMERHHSSHHHEHNPSLATWLSTAISEHAIAQLSEYADDTAAAAAEICSSPFGYELQLDAIEQDRMVLKDYLSSLREQQHQVN